MLIGLTLQDMKQVTYVASNITWGQELSLECFEKLWLYTCMKYSKTITVTEYLLHVSVHEIETNEGDNLFTLRQEKIK